MSIGELLRFGVAELKAAASPTPDIDARHLLAAVLGVSPGHVIARLPDPASLEVERGFKAKIRERAAGHPVSHLTGTRAFYGRDFSVTPDVLDPRPETEELVAQALDGSFATVLDLGTGSGCIAITLLAERPAAQGVATDISAAALQVAVRNAAAIGVADRLRLQRSDWFSEVDRPFDLIVSNPPYISAADYAQLAPELYHEPKGALTPGGDGLDGYRAIAAGASAHLSPGGRVLVEIGPGQAHAVKALFIAGGLEHIAVYPDLDGRDRVVGAQKPTE